MCNKDIILIGKITAAQGLHGEVRLFHDSGDDEALGRLSSLFLKNGEACTEYRIDWLRMHKRTPIIKLIGVDDRASAEALIEAKVYALLSESRPDEEGAWLASDLIGLRVLPDMEGGAELGRVKSVINNPAHDILEIETEDGAKMLPLVDVFVSEVDIEDGIIKINPPEGWLEI